MKPKSVVLRLLYYADRSKIDSESRIHALAYLVSKQIEMDCSFDKNTQPSNFPRIHSEAIDEGIDDLMTHRLVDEDVKVTIGGDERVSYFLTERGIERTEKLMTDSEEEQAIKEVFEEYGDYPVSNLLAEIRESEPAHEWH